MKKTFFLLFLTIFATTTYGQLNMSLVGQLDYSQSLSDIWGWADEDGTEYALVGARNGFSIVSLADPENPEEVQFIPGQNTTWRDIKTWGDHAYVISDATTEGLLVVDLSQLPDAAPFFYWTPEIDGLGVHQNSHNLYIDEFGIAYLAGGNLNNGGMLYIDVASNPGQPEYVGHGEPIYSHDVFARDNKMYASEIYLGRAAIYDVEDKDNTILLGSTLTPDEFTHNIWLSDNSEFMFTTDERPNAAIGAYDITDPTDITEVDVFRPIETLGAGVIPHNVHVWMDWLLISYYTDGGIIVDASRPENLIEVGNFDTFLGGDGGFNGAWGLYPYLPSGKILVTDIGNGLYVLDANLVRACWLEGTVTDSESNAELTGVDVEIDADQANLGTTGINGEYATGLATAGSYNVTFSKVGYQPKTVSADLMNGEITVLDVELNPLDQVTISGQTVKEIDGTPVSTTRLFITDGVNEFSITTNSEGAFSLAVFGGTYDIFAGRWGYLHKILEDVEITGDQEIIIELEEGYQDDFFFELNWLSQGDGSASSGFWQRAIPIPSNYNGEVTTPDFDIPNDLGESAYITGNGGGNAGSNDIDDGKVILTSPVMDLSDYGNPIVSYNLWFFNGGGSGNPPPPLNDDVTVYIDNGIEKVMIEEVTESNSFWRPRSEIELDGLLELTDNMQLIVEASDNSPGHIAEALFDAFLVEDGDPINATNELAADQASLIAYPSPFSQQLTVSYELKEQFNNAYLHVYNSIGQRMKSVELGHTLGQVEIGQNWPAGLYNIQIEADGKATKSLKVIKTQ